MADADAASDEVLTAAASERLHQPRQRPGRGWDPQLPTGWAERNPHPQPDEHPLCPSSFTYDLDPVGAGEVRFDIAGADEPVYELEYMLGLTEAAVAGRVVVVEDWLWREVLITDKLGQRSSYQVTGLLGALLYGRSWRRKAQTQTFEPYRPPL